MRLHPQYQARYRAILLTHSKMMFLGIGRTDFRQIFLALLLIRQLLQ